MKFKIMGQKGDFEGGYDRVTASEKFEELFDSGMLPVVRENDTSRILKKFEPDHDEMLWIPKIMGG